MPPVQSQADAAVLRDADLPNGWKARGTDEQLDEEAIWEALTQCLGVGSPVPSERGTPGEAARATSTTYGNQGLLVESTLSYLVTERSVQRIAEAFTAAQLERCAFPTFSMIMEGRGAVAGSVEATPSDPGLPGTMASAVRATAVVGNGDAARQLVLDYVIAFKGTAIVRLAFLGTARAVPDELRSSVASKVVART